MKTSILALLAALLAAPAPDGPAFAVEDGSVLRKRFVERTSWQLDEMSQTMGGFEITFDPPPTMEASIERVLVVVDEHGPTRDGRPAKLGRTVEKAGLTADASLDSEMGSARYHVAMTSPLVDEELLFAWNAEKEAYDVKLESEREVEGLDDVREDVDLRALLPASAVEVGAQWKIEGKKVAALFAPGGQWPLRLDEISDGPYDQVGAEDVLVGCTTTLASPWREADGEAIVTWSETREVDGRKIAVLALEIDLELASEALAAQVLAWLEPTRHASERKEMSVDARWRLAGEGTLEWDLAAGRFSSLALELEGRLAVEESWRQDFGGVESETELIAGLDTRSVFEAKASTE